VELEDHLERISESASGANYGEQTENGIADIRETIDDLLENEPAIDPEEEQEETENGWETVRGGF